MKINRKDLNRLIKKSIHRVLFEEYKIHSSDELMEYMWLKPDVSGLNVDIFVDDGNSFERNNHPLLLFVRNGYGRNVNSFIPISIGRTPYVLDNEMDFNISYEEIFHVMDFIQENVECLKLLAIQSISHDEFVKKLRKPLHLVVEEVNLLTEMATLRMVDSHLPMDVWLDEGSTYQGHAPRLKFRAGNEQRNTNEFSSMILSNNPTIENLPKNSPLRKKDIEKLKAFVINNLENLLKLANGEIDYRTEFLPNIIL